MSPELLTAIGALIVSIVTTIGAPVYIRRKAAQNELDATDLKSWQSVTGALEKERDKLLERVNKLEHDHNQKLADLKSTHEREMGEAKERIRQLENEVADLYRRLYRGSQQT